jgi:hypothetical protein
MLITIAHVDISKAGSGRNTYEIAEVTYEAFGNKKTFKVFSFVNPQVFKALQKATSGEQFNVTVGKNDKGYDAWNAIEPATGKDVPSPFKSETPKFVGDRESKDEREARQRYIIRQSSLSNAIAVLTAGAKTPPKQEEVFALAEEFVKFVFESHPVDLFDTKNDLEDVPY